MKLFLVFTVDFSFMFITLYFVAEPLIGLDFGLLESLSISGAVALATAIYFRWKKIL